MRPRASHACAFGLVLLAASPAAAQTTPTERSAASDVIRRIDALESEIRPTELGERLAGRKDADRDGIVARVAEVWNGGMQDLSDWIGHHPEVGYHEQQALDTLTAVLRAWGWDVKTGVAGIETAFVGSWDSPAGIDGPTIGLIGEYDALRDADGPYHGDQHNAQSPVALSVAKALSEYMAAEKVPGRLRFYGTPAEEVGPPAKTIMYKAHVFDDADILLRSHSTTSTGRGRAGFGVCCLNINSVKYTFTGKQSHQLASWFGRNALEAAVQFYTSVDRLRSTFRPEASIQGIIAEGGDAPNVVPARAVVDYYIRYPDEVYLGHITKMMDDAARGAAMATGTQVAIDHYGEYRDGIALGTLEELFFAYAKKMGAPAIEEEPQRPAGYEETGWVTRTIPGVGVSVASATGANHTRKMLEEAFLPIGHTGFLLDAQIMAAIAYDFLTNAKLRETVDHEHQILAGLLEEYHAKLRDAYAAELRE